MVQSLCIDIFTHMYINYKIIYPYVTKIEFNHLKIRSYNTHFFFPVIRIAHKLSIVNCILFQTYFKLNSILIAVSVLLTFIYRNYDYDKNFIRKLIHI